MSRKDARHAKKTKGEDKETLFFCVFFASFAPLREDLFSHVIMESLGCVKTGPLRPGSVVFDSVAVNVLLQDSEEIAVLIGPRPNRPRTRVRMAQGTQLPELLRDIFRNIFRNQDPVG